MKDVEISRFVDEGKEYIAKGDAIQASEKLYKAVEECVKVLVERHKLPEYEEAERDGRWKSYLLGQAARKLAKDLKERRIGEAWAKAFEIHVWGFHESRYGVEDIEQDVPYVEWLVGYVKDQEG